MLLAVHKCNLSIFIECFRIPPGREVCLVMLEKCIHSGKVNVEILLNNNDVESSKGKEDCLLDYSSSLEVMAQLCGRNVLARISISITTHYTVCHK